MKTKLTDEELWQAMTEAEHRKNDSGLPTDVRVRSFETYALCLREAHSRGYDYAALRAKVTEPTKDGFFSRVRRNDPSFVG